MSVGSSPAPGGPDSADIDRTVADDYQTPGNHDRTMNVDNDHENRTARPRAGPDARPLHRDATETVVDRSIRVSFDSQSIQRCDHCGERIDDGTQYRHVTVCAGPGSITTYSFCTETCLVSCDI